MKTIEKTAKPLVVEIDEAEKEAVSAVNEIMARHNLPCTLFEPVIAAIHRQLIDGKKNEIAAALAHYQTQTAVVEKKLKAELQNNMNPYDRESDEPNKPKNKEG